MTLVRFYILPDAGHRSRERFACRLAARGYRDGRRVWINVDDARAGRDLDELLWTFNDGSFVPHALVSASDEGDTPVVIGSGCEPHEGCDVLINLARDVPHFFSRFDKAFEIVDGNDSVRSEGRLRYAFYQDRGYPLESHKV